MTAVTRGGLGLAGECLVGLNIGDEHPVVTSDGVENCEYSTPKISSVRAHMRSRGRWASELGSCVTGSQRSNWTT